MIERWRCFVAIPLPEGLRSDLTDVVSAWRREPDAPDLRWTDPAGWHLTLAFLGWIDAEVTGDILARLVAPAGNARRADLTAGGLGAFPSPRRARVLWYGIGGEREMAGTLADGIRRALAPIVPRVEEGSPFRLHVTLGRARAERGADLSAWIARRAVPSGVVPLERVILYRSHLGRGPAQYEPLGAVTVGTGARIVRDVEAEASVHG
jgi:RNA 2',3'-cyclic 3'-phosphodiesterase